MRRNKHTNYTTAEERRWKDGETKTLTSNMFPIWVGLNLYTVPEEARSCRSFILLRLGPTFVEKLFLWVVLGFVLCCFEESVGFSGSDEPH